jgi:cell wall-associated NlpC family hydrolase
LFTSCKPTTGIITSKEVAEKKGIYSIPVTSKAIASKSNTQNKKEVISKSEKKKIEVKKQRPINDTNDNDIIVDQENTSYMVKQLINSASDNLGVSYRGGGTSKSGFDCSGLMYTTFKNFDITLPRSSHEMAQVGRKLDQNEIKKGDLIFFKTNGKSRINHVGMVVEINDDEIKFIHSSTQSGVIISSTKEPYYKRTFTQVNRILE